MTCEEYIPLISGLLDKENLGSETADLELHLQSCAHCRQLLDTLSSNDLLLKEVQFAPSEDLEARIMSGVRRKSNPMRKYLKWGAMGSMAAAVLLVIGLSYYTPGLTVPAADENAAIMTVRETEGEAAYSEEVNPAELARELNAPVVVLTEIVPELEDLQYEVLSDGSRLYRLDSMETGIELSRTHRAWLISPVVEAICSYALVQP